MKAHLDGESDAMRAEYDLDYSKAVRGKYYCRLIEEGSNIVVLEPDSAKTSCRSEADSRTE